MEMLRWVPHVVRDDGKNAFWEDGGSRFRTKKKKNLGAAEAGPYSDSTFGRSPSKLRVNKQRPYKITTPEERERRARPSEAQDKLKPAPTPAKANGAQPGVAVPLIIPG